MKINTSGKQRNLPYFRYLALAVSICALIIGVLLLVRAPRPEVTLHSDFTGISETRLNWITMQEYVLKKIASSQLTYSVSTVIIPAGSDTASLPTSFPQSLLITTVTELPPPQSGTISACITVDQQDPRCSENILHEGSNTAHGTFNCVSGICTNTLRLDIPILPTYQRAVLGLALILVAIATLCTLVLTSLKTLTSTFNSIEQSEFALKINRFLDKTVNEKHVIIFDYKSVLLFSLLLLIFIITLIGKVHTSSVYYWNTYLGPSHQQEGVIIGSPRATRSDEWLVRTPFEFSQAESNYAQENSTIGPEESPVTMNVPSRELFLLFRPQFWGHFLFDAERGFVFSWNLLAMSMFAGLFLVLMFITKGKFWLSTAGSVWFFSASFTQWWFSSVAGIVGSFCFLTIGALYLLLSGRKWSIACGAVLTLFSAVNFILFLYPPFQIPLGYLLIACLVGAVIIGKKQFTDRKVLVYRIIAIALTVILGLLLAYFIYQDIRPTLALIMSTSYPGNRVIDGGAFSFTDLFSGTFTFFIREQFFPASYGNVSEASRFLLLSPFIIPLYSYIATQGKIKISRLFWSLSAALLLLVLWTLIPFPHLLSKVLLLSQVTESRALLAIGLADVCLSALMIARLSRIPFRTKPVAAYCMLISAVILLLGFSFSAVHEQFMPFGGIFIISISITAFLFLIFTKRYALAGLASILFVLPNIFINPISSGTNVFEEPQIAALASETDDGTWAVYGNSVYASLLEAYGSDVFNGVKYPPDITAMSYLDSSAQYDSIYNRYAHISMAIPIDEEPLFEIQHQDAYTIYIDPCSDEFRKTGIDYLLFTYELEDGLPCGNEIFSRIDGDIILRAYSLEP